MIVKCAKCDKWFEDVYRDTWCLHDALPANDGKGNFVVHDDAYLSTTEPPEDRVYEAHRE